MKHFEIIQKNSPLSLKIISAEAVFLLLTFVIATSLINVLRPMPIGWDDIGVYMNYPRLIAESGNILHGTGMIAWHLVTATGFSLYGASLAFFVNQIGGILATIAIICGLSYFISHY